MTADFRAMCAELVATLAERIDDKGDAGPYFAHATLLLNRARVALAEPKPEGPTLDDIWELCEEYGFVLGIDGAHEDESAEGLLSIARAVLARWGRPVPAPVPVSERLPEPEDCDAEGRCWWGEPQIGDSHDATWNLCTQDEAEEYCTWGTKYGWLPAHALPLPTAND